jgi:hypothetical protein
MGEPMTDHPGFGVMIGMLCGNAETVEAHNNAKGKIIKSIAMDDVGNRLTIMFTDGTGIQIYDDGQSCCENRYMRTDDDLQPFVGATFTGCRIQEAPSITTDYEDHEVQFLLVDTSEGTFTVATHNEHNGYYGGFWIVIKPI